MRHSLKYIAILVASFTVSSAMAQDLRTAYFTDNFIYQHDLNPAFENEQNYFSVPVLGNLNVSMMGNFGYDDVVRDNPLYPDRSNKKKTSFMNPYLTKQLKGFSSGDNKVNAEAKVTIMSVGFKKWNGYNTIELNARADANINVPYKLLQFAAEPTNSRFDIGDINLSLQSFAELSFGHSRQITDKLRVGGKVKLLVGVEDAQVKMENVVADLADANQWTISANAQADVSMKGFKYLTKVKEYNSTSGTYPHVNDVDVSSPGISGFGGAIDAGAVYQLNDDLTLSAAIQDLGAIVWANDFYAENDAKTFVFDGFHDVSVDSSSPDVLDNKADKYTDQMLDFANLRDKGDKGSRLTGIGVRLSAGCQYVIPTYRQLKVGLLGMARINGPYSWTEARLSANLSPASWFDGALSVAVNNYTANFGFLANFHTKGVNFFVGMDRLFGKMSKELIPLSSNGGISMGFNILL